MDDADRLIRHLKTLTAFRVLEPVEPCLHMGAIIVGAVLQAGLNYQLVVQKRVVAVAAIEYAATTKGFLAVLAARGVKALLSWRSGPKPGRVQSLAELLDREGVNTREALCSWLQNPSSVSTLRQIRGGGSKTVDYLKILAGIPAIAIDVHLTRLLAGAGIAALGYSGQRAIFESAADRMGVNRSSLDYSIWKFMAGASAA